MGIKTVRVNINPDGMLGNAPAQRFYSAQKWLDNEVIKACNPYVPFRTGTLATSAIRHTVIGSGTIVYKTPYVNIVYDSKGWNFNVNVHPLATDHWLDTVKPMYIDDWKNGVMKILGG